MFQDESCLMSNESNLLSNGIDMRTQLPQGNIPVLSHHTGAVQMPQALVRVGLKCML